MARASGNAGPTASSCSPGALHQHQDQDQHQHQHQHHQPMQWASISNWQYGEGKNPGQQCLHQFPTQALLPGKMPQIFRRDMHRIVILALQAVSMSNLQSIRTKIPLVSPLCQIFPSFCKHWKTLCETLCFLIQKILAQLKPCSANCSRNFISDKLGGYCAHYLEIKHTYLKHEHTYLKLEYTWTRIKKSVICFFMVHT